MQKGVAVIPVNGSIWRSGYISSYSGQVIIQGQDMIAAAHERGANAVVGVDLDYETIQIQDGGSMLMVSCSGTAVVIE